MGSSITSRIKPERSDGIFENVPKEIVKIYTRIALLRLGKVIDALPFVLKNCGGSPTFPTQNSISSRAGFLAAF
jgi:hypothetical protein